MTWILPLSEKNRLRTFSKFSTFVHVTSWALSIHAEHPWSSTWPSLVRATSFSQFAIGLLWILQDSNHLLTTSSTLVLISYSFGHWIVGKESLCLNSYFVNGIGFVGEISMGGEEYSCWSRDSFVELCMVTLAIDAKVTPSFSLLWLFPGSIIRAFRFLNPQAIVDIVHPPSYFFWVPTRPSAS